MIIKRSLTNLMQNPKGTDPLNCEHTWILELSCCFGAVLCWSCHGIVELSCYFEAVLLFFKTVLLFSNCHAVLELLFYFQTVMRFWSFCATWDVILFWNNIGECCQCWVHVLISLCLDVTWSYIPGPGNNLWSWWSQGAQWYRHLHLHL